MKKITKKLMLFLFFLLVSVGSGFGQVTETFNTASLPAGWASVLSPMFNIQQCQGAGALGFDESGDGAITPAITNPNKLDFNKKRSSNSTAWSMLVQISSASPISQTSGPWTTVQTITSIATACGPESQIDLSSYTGLRYVRFIDNRGSGSAQRAIDDVTITVISSTPELQLQYNTTSTNQACGATYAYGTQTIGTNTDNVVRISNTGASPLNVSSLSGLSAPFSLVSPPALPFAVAAGSFVDITVRYSPTATVLSTKTLTIGNDDTDEGSCTVNFTGTGLAPSFSFSTATATIAENGGSINVIVNQSIATVCNVNVALTGGTAPNTDFTFTSPTTLNFNGTLATQLINIPIIDNGAIDGSRTFILTLQTATGSCAIGTPISITVTITDDEVPTSTVFKPGDLVFVGFDAKNAAGNDDVFFMTMVDIVPGTTFSYVNSRFEAGAAACTRTMRWGGSGDNPNENPGILQFTLNDGGNIIAGSIVKFTTGGVSVTALNVNGVDRLANFTVTNPGSIAANITTSGSDGDQMYLVQGSFSDLASATGPTKNVQFTGRVLYGLTNGVNWIPFGTACSAVNGGGDDRQSRLHPDLECFNFESSTQLEAAYYPKTSLHTGTKRALLSSIKVSSSWTTGTTVAGEVATTTFTINASNPAGTWVGDNATNSNDWFTCGNWEGLVVPDKTVDVVVPNVTNSPRIDVDGYTVGCVGSSTSDKYLVGGVRLAACKTLTLNGERLEFGIGSSNNGSTADRLDIYENLTISNTVGSLLDMDAGTSTQDGTINLYGNWINNLSQTAFDEGNGTVSFVGAIPQTITTAGGTETFAKVNLNNLAGLSLSNTNMLISKDLTFTNGVLTANNANTARVEFLAGSSAIGAGTGKYVAGWVRKVGNTAFDFPVGDEGYYALARISAPSNIADHFTATYDRTYLSNPYNSSSVKAEGALTLNHVDNCEYWEVQRTNGSSDVYLTLAYEDTRSCKITPGSETDMRVAHWDGTQWENKGNSNTNIISSTYGTITSGAPITSFSPFTLGSISIFNPLPIEIVSFTAKINQNNSAQLDWITVSELNAKGFDIEKSFDGKTFTKIAYQKALGGVDIIKNYQMIDESFKNAAYYRLKMIDNNESFKYSKIIYLNNQKANTYELVIIPNPTQGEVKLVLGNALPTENVSLKVFSITGKEVISLFGNVLEVEKQLSNQTTQLSAGMYVVRMQIGEQILQTKLIKN